MARDRYKIINSETPFFLTCTVVRWLPIFGHPPLAQIVLDSLTFLQEENRIVLNAYIIMENHLHLVASSNDLIKEIGDFKSFTARSILDHLEASKSTSLLRDLSASKLLHKKDRQYQFWQEGSHPQAIQGEKMMEQKIEYIHYNPVRRGYVDEPLDWRYSSARNYAGLKGLIPVTTDW